MTMNKHETDLFDRCLKAWGLNAQLLMLAEESSELSTATLHLLRTKKANIENFAEEIADVELMLSEIKYFHRHTDLNYMIYNSRILKINRLIKRLEEAEKET